MNGVVGVVGLDGVVEVVGVVGIDELVGVVGVVGLAGSVWRKKLNVTPKEKKRKKAKALLFYIAKCLTEQFYVQLDQPC